MHCTKISYAGTISTGTLMAGNVCMFSTALLPLLSFSLQVVSLRPKIVYHFQYFVLLLNVVLVCFIGFFVKIGKSQKKMEQTNLKV